MLLWVVLRTRRLGTARIVGGKRKLVTVEEVIMFNDVGRERLDFGLDSKTVLILCLNSILFFFFVFYVTNGVLLWRLKLANVVI